MASTASAFDRVGGDGPVPVSIPEALDRRALCEQDSVVLVEQQSGERAMANTVAVCASSRLSLLVVIASVAMTSYRAGPRSVDTRRPRVDPHRARITPFEFQSPRRVVETNCLSICSSARWSVSLQVDFASDAVRQVRQ